MAYFQGRTDLAVEAREFIEEANGDIRGIIVREYDVEECDVHVTKVMITTKNGAKAMGKPIGTYITLDAQGPGVVDNLFITRHMLQQFGKAAFEQEKVHEISAVIPGVMGKTGMESAEIVKGIVGETAPDAVVVIDALAARSTRRLNRTIQIANTGISPGSGVGNHRDAMTMESLGVPVIAIGIPTVVDAATIPGNTTLRQETTPIPMHFLKSKESFGKIHASKWQLTYIEMLSTMAVKSWSRTSMAEIPLSSCSLMV